MTTSDHATAPLSRPDLAADSIDLILENQASTGAYPASPAYPTYQYCWLRDGAFIAHAMDLVGRHESAARFHLWAADAISRYAHKVERLDSLDLDRSQPLDNDAALHTRYTFKGEEAPGQWGSFQLDGYGFWLSSLSHHLESTDANPATFQNVVGTVVRYLTRTWQLPCFDCWEEYPTRRHTTTWASVAGGLMNVARVFNLGDAGETSRIVTERLRGASDHGVLRKFVDHDLPTTVEERSAGPTPAAIAGHERIGRPLPSDGVDGSILLTLGRFGPFSSNDPLIDATLKEVDNELVIDGGVHRYQQDEFYGGGQWPVLAGAYAAVAQVDKQQAQRAIQWIEAQADENGNLPEQITRNLCNPEYLEPWIKRWGPISSPLLWSHAMYLLAVTQVSEVSA